MDRNKPLRIKKLSSDAKTPQRAHPDDAGLDLFALQDYELPPHEPVRVRIGIAMAIPDGFVGMICDRSSMGAKGIRVLGGIVDAGYRGEVQVLLINLRSGLVTVRKGEKIAQMLILPVSVCTAVEVTELDTTARAEGGFGSTC